MKTEGNDQVNGKAENTAAQSLFGIRDYAKIFKNSKGI